MTTNWRDLPVHPMDEYAFWQDTEADLLSAREVYDRLVASGADPKDLRDLMDYVAERARRAQ